VDDRRVRELVAEERMRIEAALGDLTGDVRAQGSLRRQQTGESRDSGSGLQMDMVELAVVATLRDQLAAVERAEERIARDTFGRSVESGVPIPDERLEAEPLAELTVQEQRRFERGTG
jgi:DnaK suppressor protein